jgi:Lrp/AsnC family transcriptional regulator for asnA, asnC and gidA
MKIDKTDIALIKALQMDARLNMSEYAKELGITKNALSVRVKRLRDKGIIKGSIIQVDLTRFGYHCIANLGIKVIPSRMHEVLEYLKGIDGVDLFQETIGTYNVFVWVFLRNVSEMQSVKERVRRHPAVLQVKASIWIDNEKALARPENISLEKLAGS